MHHVLLVRAGHEESGVIQVHRRPQGVVHQVGPVDVPLVFQLVVHGAVLAGFGRPGQGDVAVEEGIQKEHLWKDKKL